MPIKSLWILAAGLLGFGAPAWVHAHGDAGAFKPAVDSSLAVSEVRLPSGVRDGANVILLAAAKVGSQSAQLRTYGLIVPNANAVLDVNTAISGQVVQVFVRPGDNVSKGQPLVAIFNPEFITIQKGYLQFLKNEERLQVLREEGRLPDYLKDAKENLRWWGMTERQVAELIDKGTVVQRIILEAPTDGFVTDMFVQPGSLINAGDRSMKQFVVIGKSVARMVSSTVPLWVEGYVYADQQALLRLGMQVEIALPGGRQLRRPLTQVVPGIDPRTQRARFLVDLGQGVARLATGQTVALALGLNGSNGTWVPRQAVLGQKLSPVVYVQAGPGRYLRKPVAVLGETGDWFQVTGVDPRDTVVVDGKMILEGLFRISGNHAAAAGGDHHH
jgi:Cu(I)/Ag(I) efflux system membrane fusion protein